MLHTGRSRVLLAALLTIAPAAAHAAAPDQPLPGGLGEEEIRTIQVFRKASASVAFITSVALQRDFFSLDVMQIPQGSGSGFVWDDQGHIVTNFHVIADGSRFRVTLADGSDWDAKVIGYAEEKDVAVLQVPTGREHLEPIVVGRSRDLVVGQRVLAIGNPFGLDHTLTVGVVSALGRELQAPNGRMIRGVIQTDAAINPGNSGGPLLDSSGRLVGMNAAIYSPSGGSAGIGFAIPVDTIHRLVPQLIKFGRAVHPGIGIVPLADQWADQLGLSGVVIREVDPGSPAAKAGLTGLSVTSRRRIVVGDRIVAIDGRTVSRVDDLLYRFEDVGVGHQVALTVERDGRQRDVTLTLIDEN
jgi:S1-C subfamily serine protease